MNFFRSLFFKKKKKKQENRGGGGMVSPEFHASYMSIHVTVFHRFINMLLITNIFPGYL